MRDMDEIRKKIGRKSRSIAKKHMDKAVKLRGCYWPRNRTDTQLKEEKADGCHDGEHHWFCVQCPVNYGGVGCKKLRGRTMGYGSGPRKIKTFLFVVKGVQRLEGVDTLNGFVIHEEDR